MFCFGWLPVWFLFVTWALGCYFNVDSFCALIRNVWFVIVRIGFGYRLLLLYFDG